MLKKGKKVWQALGFCAILLVLLVFVNWLFVPKNNTREAGIEDFLRNGYLGEPENTVDIMILGDSIPKFGVVPMELWREQGYTSYVAAPAGEALPKNEEVMELFFAHQSPKLVLLETNTLLRGIPKDKIRQQKLERLLPILRYHDNWKFVPLRQMLKPIHYDCTTWEKGYYLCKLVDPAEPKPYEDTGEKATIPRDVWEHVIWMRDRCREKGAKLILFSMPNLTNMTYANSQALTEFCQEQQIPYLDMNLYPEETNVDWSRDTVDKGDHLNYYGAKKCTAFLGNYLQKTGLLEDKRGNPAYASWDSCCQNFEDMAAKAAGNTGLEPLMEE